MAFDAFMASICSHSYLTTAVGVAPDVPASAVFTSSKSLEQLGCVVDRATRLGTLDLLLPSSSISIAHANLLSKHAPSLGAVLERQYDCLTSSRHKSSARSIAEALLGDAIAVYAPNEHPIRRAGVVVKLLAFQYFVPPGEKGSGEWNPRRCELEIANLLDRASPASFIELNSTT